jgi:hypothetical protein
VREFPDDSCGRQRRAGLECRPEEAGGGRRARLRGDDEGARPRGVQDLSKSGLLRGKEAVASAWRGYYDKPEAPFSWEPEEVEVVDSGTLAYSGGPVYDPNGKVVGRFNSIWRLEAPGMWKVIFDRGSEVCDCKK